MARRSAALLLRVYIGELDKVDGKPLYEAIVARALDVGLDGATVLRGVESYGTAHRLHSARVLRLAGELPMVIEIVDTEERITSFLEVLDDLLGRAGRGGLITLESVECIHYSAKST